MYDSGSRSYFPEWEMRKFCMHLDNLVSRMAHGLGSWETSPLTGWPGVSGLWVITSERLTLEEQNAGSRECIRLLFEAIALSL